MFLQTGMRARVACYSLSIDPIHTRTGTDYPRGNLGRYFVTVDEVLGHAFGRIARKNSFLKSKPMKPYKHFAQFIMESLLAILYW